MRAIPWSITAAACTVALWLSVRGRTSAPKEADGRAEVADERERQHVGTNGVGADTAEHEHAREELRATRACLSRLELAQAAVLRCRGAAGDAPDATPAPECLSDPAVARIVEQRIDDAIRDHVEHERERRTDAREKERSTFDEWSRQVLHLTADESEWLQDYACAARELRERTLASLNQVSPADAMEQMKQQREQILQDIERSLGPDRYASLRAIGGIGLIADTTDCD
jgi:hypothetical protein